MTRGGWKYSQGEGVLGCVVRGREQEMDSGSRDGSGGVGIVAL